MVRVSAVVHDYYSRLDVLRTIEQILGIPPMTSGTPRTTPSAGPASFYRSETAFFPG